MGGFLHDIALIFFFPFVFLYLLLFFWSVLSFLKPLQSCHLFFLFLSLSFKIGSWGVITAFFSP